MGIRRPGELPPPVLGSIAPAHHGAPPPASALPCAGSAPRRHATGHPTPTSRTGLAPNDVSAYSQGQSLDAGRRGHGMGVVAPDPVTESTADSGVGPSKHESHGIPARPGPAVALPTEPFMTTA